MELDVSHNEHHIIEIISHATNMWTWVTSAQSVISFVRRFGSFALTKLPPQEFATLPHIPARFYCFQGISQLASTANRIMIMRGCCTAMLQRNLHLHKDQSFIFELTHITYLWLLKIRCFQLHWIPQFRVSKSSPLHSRPPTAVWYLRLHPQQKDCTD
jgi:hypothetical protein